MFLVKSYSPLDDRWEERDQEIFTVAGRRPLYSMASSGGEREHGWQCVTFDEAHKLRRTLETIDGVSAALSEARSMMRV